MVIILIIGLFIFVNGIIFFTVFKNPNKKIKNIVYDCGIVCGFPANNDGTPSKIMQSRIDAGIWLYKNNKIKKLILSGGAVKNEFVEAQVMKDYALNLGVKSKDIIVETKSRSTYHNLMYCKDIVIENNFKDCLVITNSWHLRKADHYARKFKLNYSMYQAKKPQEYSMFKVLMLHLYTNGIMYKNFFKGLS